jgi:hypothetical protein
MGDGPNMVAKNALSRANREARLSQGLGGLRSPVLVKYMRVQTVDVPLEEVVSVVAALPVMGKQMVTHLFD